MINVRYGRYAYSMSFTSPLRAFGPNDIRKCMECQIYHWDNGIPVYFSSGMSICHPTDPFDVRKGSHKALASAVRWCNDDLRQAFHSELESWFHDEQDI